MISRSIKLKGFTLIELLVVIAIIGVLSTLAVIALGSARSKARDSKRLADIKQISTALELYYSENNTYPEIITPGNSLTSPDGFTDYMKKIPSNPTPRTDGGCPDKDYSYAYITASNKYALGFCLGSNNSSIIAGVNTATTDSGIGNTNLIGWWKFDEGSGNTAHDSSGETDGALTNGPVWQANENCKAGSCLKFDGVNDSVYLGPGFYIKNMTISAWVRFLSFPIHTPNDGKVIAIVHRTEEWRHYHNLYFELSPDNEFILGFYSMSDPGYQPQITNYQAVLNTWYHVVGTYDADDLSGEKNNIYINGEKVSLRSIIVPGNIPNSEPDSDEGFSLSIGANYAESARYLDGYIDDVRIYNRALNPEEVKALYQSTN